MIYHAAGGTGLGVFRRQPKRAPGEVWAIGVDSDQWQTADRPASRTSWTSMLKRVDVAGCTRRSRRGRGCVRTRHPGVQLSVDGVGYATSGDNLSAETIAALEDFKGRSSRDITVPEVPDITVRYERSGDPARTGGHRRFRVIVATPGLVAHGGR